jgi:serine/threonine-protein kinase
VLAHRAREVVARAGYRGRPVDYAYGFKWDEDLRKYVESNDKPAPEWDKTLAGPPSLLLFWYRQSEAPLIATEFHDDRLTPAIVTLGDPEPIYSGMTQIELDHAGRLMYFLRIPPQRETAPKEPPPPPDWSLMFAAADLDASQLKPAEPEWTWLATADTRAAWTGVWPGSNRPLRVEAASWRGKPVAFALFGPWTKAERMPGATADSSGAVILVLAGIAIAVCALAAILARRNLTQGRGDRRGAARLAAAIFVLHMALWLARGHFALSIGIAGMFFIALCTSIFHAAVVWTVYLAVEPYVRRHWPRTIIALTRLLSGHFRDPVVGRDVLVGAALVLAWFTVSRIMQWWTAPGIAPEMTAPEVLEGGRAVWGYWLRLVPISLQNGLIFFFILFVLRVLLRKPWLAAAVFVAIFSGLELLSEGLKPQLAANLFGFSAMAFVVLRFGVLALVFGLFTGSLMVTPLTLDISSWHFWQAILMPATAIALMAWAFWSVVGARVWKRDFFG